MKSIKEKSKEWCINHSNKGCTEQCDGCWQVKTAFGCEQHNMKLAYKAGANYVLDEVECILEDNNLGDCEEICNELIALIEQLKK